jgi:PEGA domain
LTSCALATHGRTQTISFNSAPPGAEILVNGEPKGFTPLAIELRRNQSYEVILRFENQEQKITITNILEGDMVALDVVPAGIGGGFAVYVCVNAASNIAESVTAGLEGFFSCAGSAILASLLAQPTVVDAVNGAWYYLSPDEVAVTFDNDDKTQ